MEKGAEGNCGSVCTPRAETSLYKPHVCFIISWYVLARYCNGLTNSFVFAIDTPVTPVSCNRSSNDKADKWYKFDDGEVGECKMDDDEVLILPLPET